MPGYSNPSMFGGADQNTQTSAANTNSSLTWQAPTPDTLAQAAAVQGNDSLYLTASQQKMWANNLVYLGQYGGKQPTFAANDMDRHLKQVAYDSASSQPGGFYKKPEDFIAGVEHQSAVAGQFATQAARVGANPKDLAYNVLQDPRASASQKAMAGAWLGFTSLQDSLNQAGFYTTGPLLGSGRVSDYEALTGALQQYFREQGNNPGVNPNPMTFSEFLDAKKTVGNQNGYPGASAPGGAGGAGSSGPTFKGTSPQDIQMQGDQESQSLTGHAMSPGDSQSLVGDVTGQQRAAFNQGDIYLRSVTPQSVARQYILQNNLPDYSQHQVESYMNVFANMFLSGSSSRANTSIGDAAIGTTGGTV